jgi:VWFA-related protein
VQVRPARKLLPLAGLPLLAASLVIAQEDVTFSTGVDVVNVFATVRDKNGGLVTDLAKEDFTLKEDGREQHIQYFSRQTDLPLTIGLLVDTSMSQARVLEEQRRAAYRFLDRVLTEQDQAFVISFDLEVELLQDLTNSKPLLERALARLETPEPPQMRRRVAPTSQFPGGSPFPRRPRGPFPGGGGPRGPGGPGPRVQGVGTALYDAVYLAADEMLKNQSGRKALIVVSDGVDYGSKLTEDDAIAAVHREDGILYSVYFVDDRTLGRRVGRADGDAVLGKMSQQTGGSLYKLSGRQTIDQVFDRIEEELRSQYNLGYTPAAGAAPGFRSLELKTKDKGLTVSARSGYYADSN